MTLLSADNQTNSTNSDSPIKPSANIVDEVSASSNVNVDHHVSQVKVSTPKIVSGNLSERATNAGVRLVEKADIVKEVAIAKSTTWSVMRRRLRQEVRENFKFEVLNSDSCLNFHFCPFEFI